MWLRGKDDNLVNCDQLASIYLNFNDNTERWSINCFFAAVVGGGDSPDTVLAIFKTEAEARARFEDIVLWIAAHISGVYNVAAPVTQKPRLEVGSFKEVIPDAR